MRSVNKFDGIVKVVPSSSPASIMICACHDTNRWLLAYKGHRVGGNPSHFVPASMGSMVISQVLNNIPIRRPNHVRSDRVRSHPFDDIVG